MSENYISFMEKFGEQLTEEIFINYYDKNENKFKYNKLSNGMINVLFSDYDNFVSTIDDIVEVEFSVDDKDYYVIIRDGNVVGSDILEWGFL